MKPKGNLEFLLQFCLERNITILCAASGSSLVFMEQLLGLYHIHKLMTAEVQAVWLRPLHLALMKSGSSEVGIPKGT